MARASDRATPGRPRARIDPMRLAASVRRVTLVVALVTGTWFFLKFGSRRVPRGMDTVPGIPPGSYCIVDRWSSGLRVGSDVFVETRYGEMLSRVAELRPDGVLLQHPNEASGWPDGDRLGVIPFADVHATVVVVLQPDGGALGH